MIKITDLNLDPLPIDIMRAKTITPSVSGYKGRLRAMGFLLPPIRANEGLDFTTNKEYMDETTSEWVTPGTKSKEIGGYKQDIAKYRPLQYNLKTSYHEDHLLEFANQTNITYVSNILKTRSFEKHQSIIMNSDNAVAILASKGGTIEYPIRTGESTNYIKADLNFGKIHSNSATSSTLNSLTIQGDWANPSTKYSDIWDGAIMEILEFFDDMKLDLNSIVFALGKTVWKAFISKFDAFIGNTNEKPLVNRPNVVKPSLYERIVDGVKFVYINDKVNLVDNTSHTFIGDKELFVSFGNTYNDYLYFKPASFDLSAPVRYWNFSKIDGDFNEMMINFTTAKHLPFVDTNTIGRWQVIP